MIEYRLRNIDRSACTLIWDNLASKIESNESQFSSEWRKNKEYLWEIWEENQDSNFLHFERYDERRGKELLSKRVGWVVGGSGVMFCSIWTVLPDEVQQNSILFDTDNWQWIMILLGPRPLWKMQKCSFCKCDALLYANKTLWKFTKIAASVKLKTEHGKTLFTGHCQVPSSKENL